MKPESPALTSFLDEVEAHLGRAKGKRDILLELESAVLDRAEEIGGGEADEASIATALAGVGDPAEVALSYAGERYLVGPRVYRPFVVYTGILFAVHLVMIVVASVLEAEVELLPVLVFRIPHPHTLLNLLAVATQALLVDIGLMVVIFAGISRVQHTVRLPRMGFRVETGLRPSLTRVTLALLVLVLLNFLRNKFFIVMLEDGVHPIFTNAFVAVLPYLDAFLGLVILKELGYAFLGERRGVLAADGAVSALGATLMIWFLSKDAFVAFPIQVSEVAALKSTLNQLMHKLTQLVLIAFAVAFTVQCVKRLVRLRQIWP